jgi:hypothetical protein
MAVMNSKADTYGPTGSANFHAKLSSFVRAPFMALASAMRTQSVPRSGSPTAMRIKVSCRSSNFGWHVTRGFAHNAAYVSPPPFERLSSFRKELMALINSRYA